MTKTQLQQELKEKVKEGVKPSHLKKLKRSKSADDIRDIPKAPSLPTQPCKKCNDLQQQLNQANSDWIIASQRNLDYLKQWAEQNNKIKSLTQELNQTIDDAVEEIDKSDKDKSRLRTKLSQAQTQINTLKHESRKHKLDLDLHQRAAEFRLNKPNFNKREDDWTNVYVFFGLLALTYWLSYWLDRNQK